MQREATATIRGYIYQFDASITDDRPDPLPVTEAEIDVFEQWFGNLFDELFGATPSSEP